ncbi:contact-dependent growth inhibition system immunity protein [Acerihabitans sp. KWT182]|uniref:Contact-dependent growth inhibition system immunity protein n=1 Tax=Acerihabitans sp. KWT182 TaxID=3157919 RepID=A0AAU7Q8G2_9GAMM
MNDVVKTAWANATMNPDFFCIETYSGYGATQLDPRGAQHITALDTDNADLGNMILDALSHSRFVLPKPRSDVWIHPDTEFDAAFYDQDTMKKVYDDWQTKLILRFGYKNKQQLLKKMNNCGIHCVNDLITICPSNHDRLNGWSGDGLTDADNVVIPADSTAAEIGAALRLAFSRCIG